MKEVYFKKTIGKYKKGSSHLISDGLANVYLRANIISEGYIAKIPEPISKGDFHKKDMYDTLSVEELRSIASERGVKVHHKAGEAKLKDALRLFDGDNVG